MTNLKIIMELTADYWNGDNLGERNNQLEREDQTNRGLAEILNEIRDCSNNISDCWYYWHDYFNNFDYVDLDEVVDESGNWVSDTTVVYTVRYYIVDDDSTNEFQSEDANVLVGEYEFSDEDFAKYLWKEQQEEA